MANNPNLNVLTYNAKAVQAQMEFYSPVATIQGQPLLTIYAFLGQADPWPYVDGVEIPEQPRQDQRYLKKVFKNMFVAKLINTSNICPVLQRIDWTNNRIYAEYSDTIDMLEKDANGFLIHNFYVKNRYDQVFKCLCNNNGAPSTEEPYFQPGSYGTNNIYQNADGYKWKFIYTIDAGSKRSFMDSSWMPVLVGVNVPQPIGNIAGYGDIEVINITDGGSGYDPINAPITVTVSGDGLGATGNVTSSQVSNGVITDVVVRPGFAGKNYTNATVTISSAAGSGATAIAPASPIGGHAWDPISELGCDNLMYTAQFNGTEDGLLPVDGVKFRQVGLLALPMEYGSTSGSTTMATGDFYNTTLQLLMSSGQGSYLSDEIVKQYDNSSPPVEIFSGTVLNFDSASNILQVINTYGSYTQNQGIKGMQSGTFRTLFTASESKLVPYSGYIMYIENRIGVQRSPDGIEHFKFVLGF